MVEQLFFEDIGGLIVAGAFQRLNDDLFDGL